MQLQRLWLAALLVLAPDLTVRTAGAQSPAENSPAVVRWNAARMGAVADGITDNTQAFQKALDTAHDAGGGVVEVPAGRYRVNGTLSIPAA